MNFVNGQPNCVQLINSVQEKCRSSFPQCSAEEIIKKADEFSLNSADLRCQNTAANQLTLADFYLMAVSAPYCTSELALQALDKSIECVTKSGEIKPDLMESGGEGARRMLALYDVKSTVFFDLKDQELYDAATIKSEYWAEIYAGVEEKEGISTKVVESKVRDTLRPSSNIVRHPHIPKYVIKPVVVFTANKDDMRLLSDHKLKILAEPYAEIITSDFSERYRYSLSFEENTNYMVSLSYPSFEDQFFQFTSTQVPEYDTIFVLMFPENTSLYYTKFGKRSFTKDSLSIVIMRNRFGSESAFNNLIDSLELRQDELNKLLYRKLSGKAFGSKEDSTLFTLRKQKNLVEVAGHNLGTIENINILTNQVKIIWKKEPENRSPEEMLQIDTILQKHQLTEFGNGIFAAPVGIGFGLNTIIEELNQEQLVKLAYPETHQLISLH